VAVATDILERIVLAALAEDVGQGDVTTEATVSADAVGTAELFVKEAGVVCGLRAAEVAFRALDSDVEFEALVAAVAAGNMATGEPLSDTDRERLGVAASRLQEAARLARGN